MTTNKLIPVVLDDGREGNYKWIALDPGNASKEAFPAVWPIRTLRSDIEPANFCAKLGLYSMDSGTPLWSGTWQAALAGASEAVAAATWLAQCGDQRAALVLTRPPGHHAGRDFFGGYSFLNNAALAAQTLRNLGKSRVAVLDVDYHHGNGTQSIFYDRADVFFASIHGDPHTEYPFFLGYADERGDGEGLGTNLNLPLPARSDAATWFAALDGALVAIHEFAADALVVSLGLDTFGGDPIASFQLFEPEFERLGRALADCQLPTVLVFEGGYAANELGQNLVAVLRGFEV